MDKVSNIVEFKRPQVIERKPPEASHFLDTTVDKIVYQWRHRIPMRNIAKMLSTPARRVYTAEIEGVIRERVFGDGRGRAA
jgi:hypothetical protein